MPDPVAAAQSGEVTAPPHGDPEQVRLRDVGELVARLADRYDVSSGELLVIAEAIYARYREVPVRAFISILVEKELRDWLSHRQRAAE